MKKNKKVLHVLNSNRFSGAENVVCQIINMFKNDENIEMIYCSRDGQIREALEERNIHFVSLKEMNIKELKRVINYYNPDVIHAHDMKASFISALSCGKIPLISHIHNNSYESRGISLKSLAYLFASIKAKHIFWVSDSSYKGYAFHKFFNKKSSVLYNIIDINDLYKKMKTDCNAYNYEVIYMGRLTYQKNPQRLMQVFEKIIRQKPNVKIGVVGTGELETETKELCKTLGLQDNVKFLGFQSNPLKILYDAKVMIMTSRWEGTPMCALEAMALGVPVVSTPTDGMCEIVFENKTGFLSEDNDILVAHVIEIINDYELQKKLSENSILKSIELNDLEMYKKYICDYYELKHQFSSK